MGKTQKRYDPAYKLEVCKQIILFPLKNIDTFDSVSVPSGSEGHRMCLYLKTEIV